MNGNVDRVAVVSARLIGVDEVAALLGISRTTVERQHAAGKLPAPRRLCRRLVWDLAELNEWISRPKPDGSLLDRSQWSPVWASLVRTRAAFHPSQN